MTDQVEKTKGKNVEDLNKINEPDLNDIYRTLHSKFQRTEITQFMFSDCSEIITQEQT